MFRKLFDTIRLLFDGSHTSVAKITCYHCGDKSTPSRTVYVKFDGNTRAVCCNGCAAILNTVEELGMRDEYLAHKIQLPLPHE